MKRFALTAIILSIATPVLADQPITPLDVRKHFAADNSGNEARVYVNDYQLTAEAARQHVEMSRNSDMNGSDLTVEQLLDDGESIVNERAARIFQRIANEEDNS